MEKNKKKSPEIETIIYGSKDYDYDDSSLSIYGIDEDGNIVDEEMREFNESLEKEIAEILKKSPKKRRQKILDFNKAGDIYMTKKLIGYSRPNLNGNETPEEKEEKMDDYVKFLVKQVVENSNGDFGEYDEKAVDEILKKEHKKR